MDWNNLTADDTKKIIKRLESLKLSDNDIAGFGVVKTKEFDRSELELSKKFYKEMVSKTKDYYHARAKAKVKRDGDKFIVSWIDAGFENATTENLLSLIQQYDNNFYFSNFI